ncbi:MAG TPA: sugar ABC transporter permease [Acidimicrobiales bacterium]|jgi:multiple sugar transport system permease protein
MGGSLLTPKRSARRRRQRRADFALFAAPGILVYVCFVLAPIVLSFSYSLTDYNPFSPPTENVGARNYQDLFSDQEFLQSLRVTTTLTLIVVIVPNVLGLAVALLLDRRGWLYNGLRSVFFVPMVLSSVVVSVIWTRLLDHDGPVNHVLRSLGVSHPPGWLSDPDLALYTLSSIVAWQMLGFCVVVWLAGLQSVPRDLLEAAELDGATAFQRFRDVTWRLLAPALTINTVVLLISAFKLFDHVQVITRGGPGRGTTNTIAFNILDTGFTENRQGYASAMAVTMLVIIACASAVALKLLQRREISL